MIKKKRRVKCRECDSTRSNMRRSKRVKSAAVVTALTASMLAGTLTGCGGTSSSAGGSSSDDPITLTVYSQRANYSGEEIGWSAQILLDKFNVKLNIVPDDDGVFETRMENGDLGDIVVFGSDTDYKEAVDQNMLYDWNEDDLLADYGSYIKENMSAALDKNADISGGNVYGLGMDVAQNADEHQSFFYTWDVRWDLYKELGYPEVNDWDDLVDLFTQMKEICPTDDNGNPTYAVSLWPDWDGDLVMYVKSTATAYYGYDELGIGLYDPETGDFHGALEDNSPYLTALKFYNKLFQAGLVDPDSMTATYDTAVTEKTKNGGTFFSIFNYSGCLAYNTDEHTSAGKMMCSLVPTEASPIVYGLNPQGSNAGIWAIGANCEYPELCMEILNWLATPEGRMTSEYGPEGDCWYYDENGNTYFTEIGKACQLDSKTEMTGDYSGTFKDGMFQFSCTTWNLDAENPDSVEGETFNDTSWASEQTDASCDIEQDWRDYTGCNSTDEYMETTNYKVSPGSSYSTSKKSDELKTTWEQVSTCIKEGSWNAMYASTDEEYEQIVAQMIEDAKSYGYDECVEWSENEAATRYACEQEAAQ